MYESETILWKLWTPNSVDYFLIKQFIKAENLIDA